MSEVKRIRYGSGQTSIAQPGNGRMTHQIPPIQVLAIGRVNTWRSFKSFLMRLVAFMYTNETILDNLKSWIMFGTDSLLQTDHLQVAIIGYSMEYRFPIIQVLGAPLKTLPTTSSNI